MKEIRLEERRRGFFDCLEIFEKIWRDHCNDNIRVGMSAMEAFDTQFNIELWQGIEKAQSVGSKIDRDYKTVMFPRVYGTEFPFPNKEEDGDQQ